MEVSGAFGGDQVDDGRMNRMVPDRLNQHLCDPCESAGKKHEADAVCADCAECLCNHCVEHHKNTVLGKHHKVLDISQLPGGRIPDNFWDQACTIVCGKHTHEFIKFFCHNHGSVDCEVCNRLYHPNCCIDFIPDVANGYRSSTGSKELRDRLEEALADIQSLENELLEKTQSIQDQCDNTLKEIRDFRQKMNDYFESKERELKQTMNVIDTENKTLLASLRQKRQAIHDELKSIKVKLYDTELTSVKLFVYAKQEEPRIADLVTEAKELRKCNKVTMYHFEPHEEMKNILNMKRSLGCMVLNDKEKENFEIPSLTEVSDGKYIKILKSDDREKCRITGMTCLGDDDNLAAVDSANWRLKVYNTKQQKMKFLYTFSSQPWDVAAIGNSRFAVTLPTKSQIHLLSMDLMQNSSFPVHGRCLGISSNNEFLAVAFNDPPKVELIDFNGQVLRTIDKDSDGKAVFENPVSITIALMRDGENIFVSDTSYVIQMSREGALLSRVRVKEQIRGIVSIVHRQIAVCSKENDHLLILTDDGWTLNTVGSCKIGPSPLAIAVNKQNMAVYVSSSSGWLWNQNYIFCYQIAEKSN